MPFWHGLSGYLGLVDSAPKKPALSDAEKGSEFRVLGLRVHQIFRASGLYVFGLGLTVVKTAPDSRGTLVSGRYGLEPYALSPELLKQPRP